MRLLISLLAFMVIQVSVMAALRICSSCGYEIPENAIHCTNCGAKVPERKSGARKEAGASQKPSDSASLSSGIIDIKIIDEEIRFAGQKMQESAYDLGGMILKNAATMNLLTANAEDRETRAKKISALLAASKNYVSVTHVLCPACGGTGKRMMKVDSLATGKVEMQEAYGMHCLTCKGSGKVSRASTVGEHRASLGRAMKEYTEIQRMRGYEQVGGAWLPVGTVGKLKPSELATVRKNTAAPCKACGGIGAIDCRICNGIGIVKCKASGCVEGRVTTVVGGTLARGNLTRSEPCKQCNGTGNQACEGCRGKGSVLCTECNGSGERYDCKRCGGQGYFQCKSCGGVGSTDRGICTTCGGAGDIICSSCNGDGKQ